MADIFKINEMVIMVDMIRIATMTKPNQIDDLV